MRALPNANAASRAVPIVANGAQVEKNEAKGGLTATTSGNPGGSGRYNSQRLPQATPSGHWRRPV